MKCDKGCGKNFDVKELKVEKVERDIERNYFVCPYCNHDYTCFYTNSRIRNLMLKQRRLIVTHDKRTHEGQTSLKARMDELQKSMEENENAQTSIS